MLDKASPFETPPLAAPQGEDMCQTFHNVPHPEEPVFGGRLEGLLPHMFKPATPSPHYAQHPPPS
jgi:hypothetical protein